MTLNQISAAVKESLITKQPVLIAIEGYGGAGKSTFAVELSAELGNCFVINIDDYIIKEMQSDAIKSNFDRTRLELQVLEPLANGLKASYQRLIWDTNSMSAPVQIPDSKYVIVEGVSSYSPEIEHYYDFKIWVEASPLAAQSRGSERDRKLGNNNDALWDGWTSTYTDYKNQHHIKEKADFIYDNS